MDRGSQVLHHGFQRDLLQWIDHADVCLLPYPEEAALFGGARNKLLEFVARAKRIVTTVEGLRGLSQIDGWDGVTVTSDSPVEFAAAIEMAISGSTFSHVRDDALEGWSWRASANSLSRHLSVGESDPRELAATHLR
jgi:glycosyltransferase involved in cell wall biosynthesis